VGYGRFDGETLLVIIYVNDLDSNISNAIGIKPTFFAYESNILNTATDSQDLIFNIDRNKEISCPGFMKQTEHK